MSLANFNYPPPKNWQDFESLCRDLWREIWKDPNTKKHGRSGQDQQGVDVYGQPDRGKDWAGVQCKGKDNTYSIKTVTEAELLEEVKKAKQFEPLLSEWVLATTGPRDAKIEKKARKLNTEHQKKGLFTVHIWFWEDIVEELVKHQVLMGLHLPQVNFKNSPEILTKLENTETAVETLTVNSAQQTATLEAASTVLEDLSKKIDTIQQIRYEDILTPYVNADIDAIRDQINEYHYEDSIKALERLKERIWSDSPDLIKFRILSNLGSAFYGLDKLEEAGRHFKEAYPYNPDNEIALTNLALAYSFESDDENTNLYAQKVLEKNDSSINAYTILLQTPPCKDSLENSLALVPEKLKEISVIAFSIGLAAQHEGKFSESLEWFEKAVASEPENPIFKGYLGTMLIQSLWNERSALLYGQISEHEKEVLNRAIQILSEALLKIKNTDLRDSHLSWLLNRGIAKKLLGENDEAFLDIKLAYDADPNDVQFIKHLALVTFRTKHFQGATELLEKIKSDRETPEASILLADNYNFNDNPEKAIEVIDEFLTWNENPKLATSAHRILTDAYVRMKDYEKAEAEVEKLIEDYPLEPFTFLEAAKVAFESKSKGEARDYLSKAKELITEKTTVADICELGDAFFGLKMYRESAECYEKIADPDQDTIFTYKLVNAYYHVGTLSKVLSICRTIREKYGINPNYAKTEIWTLEEISDLPQEVELAREFLKSFPDDLRVKVKLAQVSFLLEDFDTTDKIINQEFDIDKLPLDVGIVISSSLALRGELKKSFDLMYELRRRHFDQAEIHSFYQSNFFQNNKDDSNWLVTDIVAVDTAVGVEGLDGRKRWFVIEERTGGDLSKNEFNIDHPIIVDMLGKKVGDEVQLKPGAQNSETGKIFEIKHKYVYASHETAEIYETAFPERNDFQSIHVGDPGEQDDELRHEKIREMLGGRSEYTREGLSYYRQELLTIGMVGKFLGLEGLEIWNSLLSDPKTEIFTSNGDINFLNNTITLLTKGAPHRIVADITSLQLMYELNVGDEIVAHFGKLLIAPTTMASISRIIKNKERNLGNGYFTIFEEDGQLFRHEISPEVIENTVKYLKDFQTWVKNNTEISAYRSGFDIDREQKTTMREALVPEFFDTIQIVENEDYLLLTEDDRLRQFARALFDVQGVWMQPVLAALLNKSAITREKYYSALVKLSISNLQFINIDAVTLIEVAKTVNWTVDIYFKRSMERLSEPRSEIYSSLRVAVAFLLLLAKENIDSRSEELMIICLLENITKGRNIIEVLYILRKIIEIKFTFLPSSKIRVLKIINTWKKAQIFKMKGLILPL